LWNRVSGSTCESGAKWGFRLNTCAGRSGIQLRNSPQKECDGLDRCAGGDCAGRS